MEFKVIKTVLIAGLWCALGASAPAQDIILDRDAAERLNERLLDPGGSGGTRPAVDFDALVNQPTEGPVFVYGTSFRSNPGDEFERGELVVGILAQAPDFVGVPVARRSYEMVTRTAPPEDVWRTVWGSVERLVQTGDGDLFAGSVYLNVYDRIPGRTVVSELGYLVIGDPRTRQLFEIEAEFARPSGDARTDWINPRNWDHLAQSGALTTRCAPGTPLARAEIEAGLASSGSALDYTLGAVEQTYLFPRLAGFTDDARLVVQYEFAYSATFSVPTMAGFDLEVSGTGEISVGYARGGDDIWRISDCDARPENVAPLPDPSEPERLSVSEDGKLIVGGRVLLNREGNKVEPSRVSAVAGPRP